ncbi:MAG: hypothetical protein KKF48_05215 [Nanoarchaeota archaeon]|nr:hypothetical protein [Nanoarchaeota archaeon]MBU1028418.1 hypothetical protein [Nanoarchaeota archaeon]
MKFKGKMKRIPKSWYFLVLIVFVYFLFSLFNKEVYLGSLNFFNNLILKIIPIFLLVFVLMSISNYFITPYFVIKYLKEKGIRKWFFVIIGGILSSGPIYMWYPLLADLRNKGLNYGLIACFLYNRAIKIPLIPLAIVYFSWQYIVILLVVMVFASVIQGVLLNKLMEVKK